jgi:hypothetical protein
VSKMQRDKGATFEREIANELSQLVGRKVQRNIGQVRDGGDDITLPPYRFECKRRASIAVYQWLDQCAEACANADPPYSMALLPKTVENANIPIVVARADHRQSIVVMNWETFKTLLAQSLHPLN